MGNACLSKHQSFAGAAPRGHYVATAAPEPVAGTKTTSLIGNNYVKTSRKGAKLILNAPLPEEPPEARKAEEAAQKKEQQKRIQVRFYVWFYEHGVIVSFYYFRGCKMSLEFFNCIYWLKYCRIVN